MFRIVKYRNVSGKILITIETNDQTAADFLRFFGSANKFVELFHYRVRAAKGFNQYQKTVPVKMALVEKEYAEQLNRFRELPGTRIQRLRILKEIRESYGEKVTLDRIEAEIRCAIKHEKDFHQKKVKSLLAEGKTLNDISNTLNLSKSTIARYIGKLRPPGNPVDQDLPAPELGASPKGA